MLWDSHLHCVTTQRRTGCSLCHQSSSLTINVSSIYVTYVLYSSRCCTCNSWCCEAISRTEGGCVYSIYSFCQQKIRHSKLTAKDNKKMFLFGTAAHLGFYKGGCPIHLKGAPEVEHRRRRGRWGMGKELCPLRRFFFVFLVSKLWVFMHFRCYLLTLLFI